MTPGLLAKCSQHVQVTQERGRQVFNFVTFCDVLLHCRQGGLAFYHISVKNKPIIGPVKGINRQVWFKLAAINVWIGRKVTLA
jgi:hypothetical protein